MSRPEALYEAKVPLLKMLEYHLISNGGSVEATFYMGTFALRDGDTVYQHGSVQIGITLKADSSTLGVRFDGHPWYNTTGHTGPSFTTVPPATELGGAGQFRLGDLIYLCGEDGCLTVRVKLRFESRLVASVIGQYVAGAGTYVNYDRNGTAVECPTPITTSDCVLKISDPNFSLASALPSHTDLFPGPLFEANPPMTNWQVRAGSKVFHTHKVVLGAASDFFIGMFDASDMKEGRTGEVEVHDLPVESVEAFLTLIYKPAGILGYITEGASVLCDVYSLAHMYRVTRSVELCKMVFNFIKMDEGSLFNAFALLAEHEDLDSLEQQCKAVKATHGDGPQFQDAICDAMAVNPTLTKDVFKCAISAECLPVGIWITDDFANFIKDNPGFATEILESAISAKAFSAEFWESDGFAEFAKANFNLAILFLGRSVTGDLFREVLLKLYPVNDPSASPE